MGCMRSNNSLGERFIVWISLYCIGENINIILCYIQSSKTVII